MIHGRARSIAIVGARRLSVSFGAGAVVSPPVVVPGVVGAVAGAVAGAVVDVGSASSSPTFVQTIELPLKRRLVASSNS